MPLFTENRALGARTKCVAPERNTSKDELAYLAGLFDGEGCVTIALNSTQHGPQHIIACLLSLTLVDPVNLLAEVFGGKVYGPKVRPDRQDQFIWEASPKIATIALHKLLSFLRVKRRQAELVLFFQENRSRPVTPAELCWRDQLRREIHRLNGNNRRKRNSLPPETLAIGPPADKPQWPKKSSSNRGPLLSYLAGLFDAEGCVSIQLLKQKARRQPLHRLFCTVAMTDRCACVFFCDRFGGEIQRPSRRPGRRQMYRWRIDANKAVAFLQQIRPFMRVKHEQADLAIKLQNNWVRSNPTTFGELNRREQIRQKISSLNGIKKISARPFKRDEQLAAQLELKRQKFKRFLDLDAQGLCSKAIAEELDTWPGSINRWRRTTPAYALDLI